ncbi:N-acetylmuramoyl-L-alanine amidase [Rahnella victoriana]|uniref:N-acetylmuramoyl-L-alanine amidase n=1 Tax=Rahnella victoriana TaxID=1510570 RepID=UPI0010E0C905|nr:N-acetylmuramoyl-L-alanine amidase [Rahnella victoriana]UHM89634.1 N-acetylmuramoyl-L-alanine amidase [Rahnella victoriana]VTQ60759.1 N-acetylmuramoyl-L-alanine amidase AmiD precursor [Campylobacter jejuni]
MMCRRLSRGVLTAALLLLAGCQGATEKAKDAPFRLETARQAQGADQRIRFLVIHYTAEDFNNALNTLTDEHVSAHYLIPAQPPIEDGKPVAWQLVPENRRAWHAGASGWRGRTNLNDTSVGIELENKGYSRHLLGKKFYPFPPAQIDLLANLSQEIVTRYQIEPRNVVGHSDIAPQRKDDPGPLFPWQEMAERGIGAWPDAARVNHSLAGRNPQQPVDQTQLLGLLKAYGYPVSDDMTPEQQRRVIAAFQMHFRQSDYRGHADAQTQAIAQALLVQYPDKND